MEGSRLDRELAELLEELRIALPGMQVLFAIELGVPFTQRFPQISNLQRDVYIGSFLATAISTALLIAPVAFHRLRWRQYDKEKLLQFGNRMLLAGLAFLTVAFSGMVFVVTDMVMGHRFAVTVSAGLGVLFVWLWFLRPLGRRLTDDRPQPPE
ncbi:MAG TPA: DUF6328 family protein [Actinomycetota bacterium]|nr:DUF6328 family protein [Actinomycetota bacterium]